MKKILATGIVVAALVLTGGASAFADTSIGAAGQTSTTRTEFNAACVTAITAAQEKGTTDLSTDVCRTTITTASGPATTLSNSDLAAAKESLSANDFLALSRAVAAGTVHSKPYSQTISQITDQETQSGTFYYDGDRAWVTVTYRGYSGTHSCKVDYAVGYNVSNTACSDSGSTSSRKLQMNWDVSVGIKGSPIAWSESYTMHVNSAGTISNG